MPRKRPNPDNQFWESAKSNTSNYILYYNRLVELAISMFKWENLPDSVDERFLELALFRDGMCVFFEDDVMGYLALRCMIGGRWDVYNIPTDRTAFASNGYNQSLTKENSVIIFNNSLHTNMIREIETYAMRLYDIDRSIDINAKAQKTPILLSCEESQRLTLKNLYMQYDGNAPVIYGDKNLSPNAIKVIQTGAPYVGDKLFDLKTKIWNEALTLLGISNLNIQKKERLVADEVVRNQGGTIASRYSRLNARKKAAEEINKMFGLNIEVSFRQDYREADDEIMIPGETGEGKPVAMATDFRTA